jgi:hypothetical protein
MSHALPRARLSAPSPASPTGSRFRSVVASTPALASSSIVQSIASRVGRAVARASRVAIVAIASIVAIARRRPRRVVAPRSARWFESRRRRRRGEVDRGDRGDVTVRVLGATIRVDWVIG